jgi:hypothetical protein
VLSDDFICERFLIWIKRTMVVPVVEFSREGYKIR